MRDFKCIECGSIKYGGYKEYCKKCKTRLLRKQNPQIFRERQKRIYLKDPKKWRRWQAVSNLRWLLKNNLLSIEDLNKILMENQYEPIPILLKKGQTIANLNK